MIHGPLLAYATDYNTNPNTDMALQQTGKMPAIIVVSIAPKPDPVIGAYAEKIARQFAATDGVLLRDYLERLIFQDQWQRRQAAEELE